MLSLFSFLLAISALTTVRISAIGALIVNCGTSAAVSVKLTV